MMDATIVESSQTPIPPHNPWKNTFFALLFAILLIIFAGIISFWTGKNKEQGQNQIPTPTQNLSTSNSPSINPQAEKNNLIYLSQSRYEKNKGFIDIYEINPIDLKTQLLHSIAIPENTGSLTSSAYNSYGANESIQWSDDKKIAIFRMDKMPGLMIDPPFFSSYYSFNPETKAVKLIYKSDKTTLPVWILSSDGKYLFITQGDIKIDEFSDSINQHFLHVKLDDLSTEQSGIISTLASGNQDRFFWSTDEKLIKWPILKSGKYYIEKYDIETKTISEQEIRAADTTYGPNSAAFSNDQNLFATAGFFGNEIFLYNVKIGNIDNVAKIDTKVKINSSRFIFEKNNNFLLFSSRKDNPSDSSQPFSELRKLNLTDNTNNLIATTEGQEYGTGYFPYKSTKYGILVEMRKQLYLYTNNSLNLISGITLSGGTAGIRD